MCYGRTSTNVDRSPKVDEMGERHSRTATDISGKALRCYMIKVDQYYCSINGGVSQGGGDLKFFDWVISQCGGLRNHGVGQSHTLKPTQIVTTFVR